MINVGISFRSEDVYSRKACDAEWANFMSELIDRWDKCALCVKKMEDLLLSDDWNRNLSKPFLFGLDQYYESHGYVLGEFSLAYAKIAMNRPVRNSVIHYVNYVHSNRNRMETLYHDFQGFFTNADAFHHSKDILKLMDEFKDHLWDLRRADAKYAMYHVSRTEEFLKRDVMKNFPEVPTIIDVEAAKRLQNRHYKRGLREIVTLCLLFDGKDRQMKKLKTQAKKAEEERYDKDFISLEELVQAYDGLTKVLMEREKLLLMEENKTKEEDQYGLY